MNIFICLCLYDYLSMLMFICTSQKDVPCCKTFLLSSKSFQRTFAANFPLFDRVEKSKRSERDLNPYCNAPNLLDLYITSTVKVAAGC